MARVLGAIRHRVRRWLARRGLEPGTAEPGPPDGLAEVSPILAQILSASVQGRVALGRHAGTRVGRLGGEPTEPAGSARGPRQACRPPRVVSQVPHPQLEPGASICTRGLAAQTSHRARKSRRLLGRHIERQCGGVSRSIEGDCQRSYPPAPGQALEILKELPERLAILLSEGTVAEAAEVAGHGYARIDGVLPGVFDMKTARKITDKLVQPEQLIIRRAMSWSRWQRGDTLRKREAEVKLRELLKQRPHLVKAFGKPYYEDDADRYWRWWEFVSTEPDGTRFASMTTSLRH